MFGEPSCRHVVHLYIQFNTILREKEFGWPVIAAMLVLHFLLPHYDQLIHITAPKHQPAAGNQN